MVSADSNVYILGYISYFSLQLGLNISLKFSQKNNNKKNSYNEMPGLILSAK